MATYINGRSTKELMQEKILRELEKLNATSDNTTRTFGNKGVSDNCPHTFGDKIFIVHGHDEAAKHKIARFITELDLSPIILDEQPSKGQTIIDKFEEHADEAGFAIIKFTDWKPLCFSWGRKIRPRLLGHSVFLKKHLTFSVNCGLIYVSHWQTC